MANESEHYRGGYKDLFSFLVVIVLFSVFLCKCFNFSDIPETGKTAKFRLELIERKKSTAPGNPHSLNFEIEGIKLLS